MSEQTEYQAAYSQGAAQKVVMEEIEGVQHVLVPPGSNLSSMEGLLPAPTRIKAHPEFNDADGFVDYTGEFKEEGSRIFVNQSEWRFFTIFDSHAKDKPAWGDHSASLQMKESHEWKLFKQADGVKMTPMDLAEFLEDNLAYISGPIEGADLLTMVQNLKVQLKGELNVEHTQQSGLKKYLIQDDSTMKGANRKGKELIFPEKIQLSLRVFDNHNTYPLSVFLRDRVSKESVTFWIKIPDIKGIEEQAFDNVINEVREKTELKTLKGRWEGPRHK
jgi:uncharacterized protein YfdQ (DUF2303 family)